MADLNYVAYHTARTEEDDAAAARRVEQSLGIAPQPLQVDVPLEERSTAGLERASLPSETEGQPPRPGSPGTLGFPRPQSPEEQLHPVEFAKMRGQGVPLTPPREGAVEKLARKPKRPITGKPTTVQDVLDDALKAVTGHNAAEWRDALDRRAGLGEKPKLGEPEKPSLEAMLAGITDPAGNISGAMVRSHLLKTASDFLTPDQIEGLALAVSLGVGAVADPLNAFGGGARKLPEAAKRLRGATALGEAFRRGEGLTYDLEHGAVQLKKGMGAWSIRGSEKVFDHPPTPQELQAWVMSLQGEPKAIGGWVDNGKYYVDVSTYGTAEEARIGGKANRQRAIALGPEEEGGPVTFESIKYAPGEEGPTTTLTHYSNRPLEGTTIEPSYFGQGQAGREKARLTEPGFLPRTYYYTEGAKPEARFAKAPFKHTVEVSAHRIYDINADPEGLRAAAQGNPTAMERAIRERGYAGYTNTSEFAQPQNTVALFEAATPLPPQQPEAKMVFHGARKGYEKVDPAHLDEGLWVAEQPGTANIFAGESVTGGNVRPYVLLPDAKIGTRADWMAAVERQGVDPRRVREDLRAQGFDAIFHEGYGGEPGNRYQVLNPSKLIEPFTGQTAWQIAASGGAGAALGEAFSGEEGGEYAGSALAGLFIWGATTPKGKLKAFGSAADRLRMLKTVGDFSAVGAKSQVMSAVADVAGAKMFLGATSKKAFRQAMVEEFGDTIIPHLDDLYGRAQKKLEGKLGQLKGMTTTLQQALAPYHMAEGLPDWYGARKQMEKLFGPDADLMAGLVAATSPGMQVADNIEAALDAYRIIKTAPRNEWRTLFEQSTPITMGHGAAGKIPNIFRAVDGVPLHGNKVNDFHVPLLEGSGARVFTSDRHIIRIAFQRMDEAKLKHLIAGIDDETYALVSEWGKKLAANLGVSPSYAQQRLWTGWLALAEFGDSVNPSTLPLWPTLVERAKELGFDKLVPKSPLMGEEGRISAGVFLTVSSALAGAVTGYSYGDGTPTDRIQNALIGLAGGALAPGVVERAAKAVYNHLPAVRNLVRHGKDPNAWPPHVQARMDQLLNAYEYELTVEQQRRGFRPHAQAHAEAGAMIDQPVPTPLKHSVAEQMIRGGRMSVDEVRGAYPGMAFNDAEAAALIRVIAQQGDVVQQNARVLAQRLQAGQPLDQLDIDNLLTEVFALRELLPKQAGALAEAGRTLSVMNEPTSGWNRYLQQWHDLFADPSSGMTPERLIAIVSNFKDPHALGRVAKATLEPGWTDIAIELMYGSMLSNPMTPTVNALMGMATLPLVPIERGFAVAAGSSHHWLEPFAQVWGAVQAIPKAFQYAGHALMQGESLYKDTMAATHVGQKVEQGRAAAFTPQNLQRRMGMDPQAYNTIFGRIADMVAGSIMGGVGGYTAGYPYHHEEAGGAAGAVVGALAGGGRIARAGSRLMMSADELLRVMLYEGEKWAQAVRKGFAEIDPARRRQVIYETLNHDTYAIRKEAQRLADEFTFNSPPGPFLSRVMEGVNLLPGPYKLGFKALFPFLGTPTDLFKFAGRRTPGLQIAHAGWLADLNTPGLRHDKAAGQLAMGAMFAAFVVPYVMDGTITGPGPSDPNVRREWKALGHQEYSVAFGDKSYSLNAADPHGMYLSLVAEWTQVVDHLDDASNAQIAAALTMAPAKTMLSKTYLEGAHDVVDALMSRDPNKAYRFLINKSAILTPSVVKQARRIEDPYLREVRDLLDAAKNRVPGLSRDLPPQRNIFAQPIPQNEPYGYGIDWIAPFRMKSMRKDPAGEALVKNDISVAMPGYTIYGTAEKKFTLDPQRETVGVPLTPDQRDELIRLIGEPLHEKWSAYVNSEEYKKGTPGPDGSRAFVFRQLYSAYREAGVAQLVDKHPQLLQKYDEIVHARARALGGDQQ